MPDFFSLCVCVFEVVLVVVVMMVLVVVVDGVGIGCGSVGGCVLFPFISYVFKSSFYCNGVIWQSTSNNNKKENNSKTSYIVCIHAVHCLIV